MKKNNMIQICNWATAALLLVMVVMQFLPFWGDVSIQSFIWLPEENKELMKTVTAQIPDFDMNDIALLPFIIMVGGAFGVYKCIFDSKNVWSGLLPLICGVCGLIAYLGHPVYAMGEGMIMNLVLAVLVTAASAYPVIRIIPEVTKSFTE